jgi:GntR family transcriptional regulator
VAENPPPRSLAELAAIDDPVERAKAASEAIDDLRALTADLAQVRREAVLELRRGGRTQAEVARLLGVTYGRVSQLEAGAPRAVLVERSVPIPPAIRAAPSLFLAEGEAKSVEAGREMEMLHVGSVSAPPQVAELLSIKPRALAMLLADLQAVLRRSKRDLAAADTAVASLLARLPAEEQAP